MRRPVLLVALLALLAFGAVAAPASARRSVPQGWSGVNVSVPSLGAGAQANNEWNRMVTTGVESIRTPFLWYKAQPYAGINDVPPSELPELLKKYEIDRKGVPTDYSGTDSIVREAAGRGLTVLPTVLAAPEWAAQSYNSQIRPPKDNRTYANYLVDLVGRYGPGGKFWRLNPDLPQRPVRTWQIWNEPNHKYFWPAANWPSTYTALLKISYQSIKQADPGARVVLAGLAARAWDDLGRLYHVNARPYFDQAAIQVFTQKPRNVLTAARLVHDVMRKNHDGAKTWMWTEFSWPAARHRTRKHEPGFVVTPREQASRIREAYPLLAKASRSLKLSRVYWYTWISSFQSKLDAFDYSGLRVTHSSDSRPASSFTVWRSVVLSLEGCRRPKSSVTVCG